VDADFEIELGAEDDALEFPWRSEDGHMRYYDLKAQPDLLLYISEANEFPELGEFLSAVNARSIFLTAKCDAWYETELNEAESIYGEPMKMGSYVDLLFEAEASRSTLPAQERLVKRLCQLLGQAPEMPAAAEFDIRRCYGAEAQGSAPGFYVTAYTFGYGNAEEEARKRWGIALKLVQNAVLQVSAEMRRQ
jgi:hypothetical protein